MASVPAIKLRYRIFPIALAAIAFILCALWLAFGPTTHGMIGEILGNGGGLSLLATLAIAVSAAMATILMLHVGRALLGLPVIELDGQLLSVYVFPFKRFYVADILRVGTDNKWLNIDLKRGSRKRVNLAIVKDWQDHIDDLKGFLNH